MNSTTLHAVSHPQPEVDGLPQKGDVLDGKYVIESPLGEGGMGVVYAAMNRDLAQPVAIKLLLPEAASHPHAVARFLREAQAAAAIQNDHVVRVYGVGKTNRGLPFMVMEHLSGSGLNDVLRDRGPFSISDAVDLVTEVCQALAHAHALGIVHRDIKPSNLFLCDCPDGSQRIKVLDFGISKVASMPGQVQVQLTATIQVLGTPAYMSPEQARSSKDVDATTDIWALGAVLYELLCGIPPFHAETLPALVAKIVADDPVRPSRLRPEIPEPLEDVILQCLEKMPARRPANIMQLAFALRPLRLGAGQGQHRPCLSRLESGNDAHVPTTRRQGRHSAIEGRDHGPGIAAAPARRGRRCLGGGGVLGRFRRVDGPQTGFCRPISGFCSGRGGLQHVQRSATCRRRAGFDAGAHSIGRSGRVSAAVSHSASRANRSAAQARVAAARIGKRPSRRRLVRA